MELHWGWPIVTTVLMFCSFWFGKIQGFVDGEEEGRDEGIDLGSKATARVVMQYMREKYELTMSDVEIEEVVDGINITHHEYEEIEDE
jgi:hypothetical protein